MNDTLRFGLVGAGYFGRHYVRLLQDMPGAALRAIADRSRETIEKRAPELPASIARAAEAEDIFSNPEIDCVVIATPAQSHAGLAVRALEAGKHILVEKPMAMNLQEAEAMRRATEKSGKTLMVGHQYLYNDHIRHLKKKFDEGMLGAVQYVFAEHFSFGPVRPGIGCFAEMAVHELAIIDYLFSPGDIADVTGSIVDFFGTGRDDFASASIRFANGLVAVVAVSWFAPEKVRRMTIAGAQGMAVFDDRREEKLKFFLHPYPVRDAISHAHADGESASRFMEYAEGEIVMPAIDAREPLRNQLKHFISCVRKGAEPISGITHGLRVTRMMEVISRAIA
ncbi:MAG: Gfo/Idh/MocA family oxidoreductase [Patescibacteria group bacterium]